jgi:hypothetical protein
MATGDAARKSAVVPNTTIFIIVDLSLGWPPRKPAHKTITHYEIALIQIKGAEQVL